MYNGGLHERAGRVEKGSAGCSVAAVTSPRISNITFPTLLETTFYIFLLLKEM
jgi:hypothetical protein